MSSSSSSTNYCCCRQGCHRRAKYVCGECKTETYCSQKCQRVHWKFEHRCACRQERYLARRPGELCSMSAYWETKPKSAVGGEMRVRVRPRVVLLQIDGSDRGKYTTTGGDAVGVVAPEDIVHHASKCLSPEKIWGRERTDSMHIPTMLLNLNYPASSAKELGAGNYGRVERRDFLGSGGSVAVKHIRLLSGGELPNTITSELTARNLSHPNVMGICYGTIGTVPGATKVPEKAVSLVMDLAATDLDHLLNAYLEKQVKDGNKYMCIPPEEFPYLAYQIARGVAYCHNNLIDMLDLKPANVLLNGTDIEVRDPNTSKRFKLKQAMLGDLGLARSFADSPGFAVSGTPLYLPPECLMRDGRRAVSTALADVWALGFIFCVMALGKHPFVSAMSMNDLCRRQILAFGLPSDAAVLDRWMPKYKEIMIPGDEKFAGKGFDIEFAPRLRNYPGLADLLRRMMRPTPYDRPDINWVLRSDYFIKTGCADAIEGMLPAPRQDAVKYSAPGRAHPQSAASVYKKMEAATWKSADDEIHWVGMFEDPSAALVAKWRDAVEAVVSISKEWNADRRAIFSTVALVRQCLMRYAKFAKIADAEPEVVALACFKLACESRRRGLYETSIAALTIPTYEIVGGVNASDLAAASQAILMSYLDFNVSVPSAYDFLRMYSRINVPELRDRGIAPAMKVVLRTKYAVATLLTLVACWSRLASADKPSEIALQALAVTFSRPMRNEMGDVAAEPSEATVRAFREDGKKFQTNFAEAGPTATAIVVRDSERAFLLGPEFFEELKRIIG